MAIAVPLAIIPGSHNSALIKLFLFTLSAGFLLLLLGLRMIRDPFLPENLPIHLLLLIPAMTALHVYAPSNPGIIRILLVSSAVAIFISLRTFRIAREKILVPLLAGGSLAVLVTLLMPSTSRRLAGLFSNANLLGSFAAAMLPVGFAFLFGRSWKKIALLILFLIICGVALVMSGTRSSIIALAGGTVAILLLRWKPGLLNFFATIFLLAVVVMVFLPRLQVPEVGGTPGVRQVIWEGSSKIFSQKPFFGWGNGSFQLLFPRFRPSDFLLRGVSTNTVHAHSEPLEILAESGLTGLILWSALIIILLRQALGKKEKTLLEWGMVTGVAVLLLEGLTSVALRWTTSVYLLTMLLSLMPVKQHFTMKKLPRWTAVLPLAAGLLLLLPGAYKAYRMTRSSVLLNSAMTALSASESDETAQNYCLESLRYNSWELGSWYTLGNIYGQEAAAATDLQTEVSLVEKQIAAYDSLTTRAEDFAWVRVNRIDGFLKLGLFDSAMDDVIYLYRHRIDLKDYCLETGYSITPLVSPGKSFEFFNMVFLEVIVENIETDERATGMRTGRMVSSILTTFALAAVHAPDALDRMRQTADSMLVQCGDSLKNSLMTSIEIELQFAVDGHDMLERYLDGNTEGLEEECLQVLSDGNAFAVYHRILLSLLAADNGNSGFEDMSYECAIVLAQPCYPLVSYYPGAGEIFIAAARIARSSGREDQLLQFFKFACEIDSYGMTVLSAFRKCLVNQPSTEVFEFWYRNGGPQASVVLLSKTGLLVSDGETRRLLQLAGAESMEFQIAAHFILSSLAISAPGSDREYIANTTLLRLQSQKNLLSEIHGTGEAERIMSGILNREIDYMEESSFNPETAVIARQLRSAFITGSI